MIIVEQKINTKYKIVETLVLGVSIYQLKKRAWFFWVNIRGADSLDKIDKELQNRNIVDPVVLKRKILCA